MSEVAVEPPSNAPASPGRALADARRERGLGVVDVAQHLKFAGRQIEALEAGDYERLPGLTIVRGMIRSYAKLLEIEAQPLLRMLDTRYPPAAPSVEASGIKPVPFPDGRRRSTGVYLGLSGLALAAVLGVLYEWHTGGVRWQPGISEPTAATAPTASTAPTAGEAAPEQPAATGTLVAAASVTPVAPVATAAPVAQGTVAASRTPAAPPSKGPERASVAPVPVVPEPRAVVASGRANAVDAKADGRIRIEFKNESWVEIRDKGGKTLMYQLNPAGTEKIIEGRPPFFVVIGNASAVKLLYNNEPVDLSPYVKIEVARLTLD